MKIRRIVSVMAMALVATSTMTFAQESEKDKEKASTKVTVPAHQVTIIGCVVTEKDYRKVHDAGAGGPLGAGLGIGGEYILVNATEVTNLNAYAPGGACDVAGTGAAYELTGGRERSVKPFLGQWVEITGIQKKAEAKMVVGTSGVTEPKPTGGWLDPLQQDLKLFEINVDSVRLAPERPAPVAAAPAPRPRPEASPAPAPAPTPEPAAEPEAAPAPAPRAELPKTASALPSLLLTGWLSLLAALAVRTLRLRI